MVYTQIYGHLRNNEIITSKQFGFRPKLSTGTALAHFRHPSEYGHWQFERSCFSGPL